MIVRSQPEHGIMTVCEPCFGAGAMEIGVDWRSRK